MNKKDNMFKGIGDTEEAELEVENTEELDKLLKKTKIEIFEIHNRFENGTYTEDDLLNHLPHYGLEFENGMKMLLVETKYFDDLANRYTNLKELEQRHREVNEKLRIELEQEKEINKEIAFKNHKIKEESNAYGEQIVSLDNQLKAKEQEIKYLKSQIPSDKIFYYSDKDYISKDKIKEKLNYQNMLWNTPNRQKEYNQEVVEVLEDLLEGK